MNKKYFISLVMCIIGLPSFAFFDGKISKHHFYDRVNTIMQEEIIDNSIKNDQYWTQNILHPNKYRPTIMISNKELINLMPKEKVNISERIVAPSVYSISLKNSSIINVSFNAANTPIKNVQTSNVKKVDNSRFANLYENAKNPSTEIEEKIDTAIILKNSKNPINFNMAIDLLDDVTRKESFNAYAFYLKGELYAMKHDCENAMKNYVLSLKINPINKDCYKSIAKLLEPTNKNLAQKYYSKAGD